MPSANNDAATGVAERPYAPLGGTTALTDQSAPLAFSGTAPHTRLLTNLQRIFQTRNTHTTVGANVLCFQRFIIVVWIKHTWVEPPARPKLTPYDLFDRHEPVPRLVSACGIPSRNRPESRFVVADKASPECAICARFSRRDQGSRSVRSSATVPADRPTDSRYAGWSISSSTPSVKPFTCSAVNSKVR